MCLSYLMDLWRNFSVNKVYVGQAMKLISIDCFFFCSEIFPFFGKLLESTKMYLLAPRISSNKNEFDLIYFSFDRTYGNFALFFSADSLSSQHAFSSDNATCFSEFWCSHCCKQKHFHWQWVSFSFYTFNSDENYFLRF